MSALFKKKCLIPSQRVCLRLKAAREEAGVTLEQMERRTKISKTHLQALEECKFDEIKHSKVYQKNFIKKYVESLGQDSAPFLEQFKEEELKYKSDCENHPGKGCKKTNFSNLPSIIRFFLVGMAVLCLLVYLGNHVRNILRAPELIVVSPSNGEITEENNIIIIGKTEPEIKVTINGESIKNDDKGNFKQPVELTPGINTLMIVAENKHGKKAEETRHVICKITEHFSMK